MWILYREWNQCPFEDVEALEMQLKTSFLRFYLNSLLYFFLVSKNDIYTKGYSMHEEHRANLENTRKGKQRKTKKKTKQQKNYKREREQRKERMESLDIYQSSNPSNNIFWSFLFFFQKTIFLISTNQTCF